MPASLRNALARIYEALPLSCRICHSQMRIIAFINEAATVKKILDHICESTQPPRIAPVRGPSLREAAAAEQAGNDPRWDASTQSGAEFEFDQRIARQAKSRHAAARRGVTRACSPKSRRQQVISKLKAALGVPCGKFSGGL